MVRGKVLCARNQELKRTLSSEIPSLASILRSSADQKTFLVGRHAHSFIISLGLEQNTLLANLLVHMYGSFGLLQDASHLFANLSNRNPLSWSFMMTAYARLGRFGAALDLFVNMQLEHIKPDKFIFASILSACADEAALATGMYIHFLIISDGIVLDVILSNAIMNMYAKCGRLDDAKTEFLAIDHKIEASFNAMMLGYALDVQGCNAMVLFHQMLMEGVMPSKVTFVAVISACICPHLTEGRQMHARLVGSECMPNVVIGNTLISMYGKCNDLKKAHEIFDSLVLRTIVSWNAMITAYVQDDQGKKAFELFDQLYQEGELPNTVTFRSLLPGFNSMLLKECKKLHTCIMSGGGEANGEAASSLINMYCKCGSFVDAEEIFDLMPEHDLPAWNAFVAGCNRQPPLGKPTHWQINQMLQEGILPDKSTFMNTMSNCANRADLAEGNRMYALLAGSKIRTDVMVGSALLNMYGKCGSLQNALVTFSEMGERNEYSWAAMIAAYALHGDAVNAIQLFEQMQGDGIMPNRVCILCLLCACSNQEALNHCKRAHMYVLESGFKSDVTVGNALLTMYSKCGGFEVATRVFNGMPKKNLISWTAAIAACAQHGQGKEAFLVFEQLQNENQNPDSVTYVEILSACSRAGLMDEAYHVLVSMEHEHGIKPSVNHYNCIVDLLSRTGRLDVAEYVIFNMPPKPTAVSWLTLLGACRSQLDLERGEHAAKWACNLSLKDAAPFVTLSNLYAESGRFDDAAYSRHQIWSWDQEQQQSSYCLGAKEIILGN